MKSSSGALILMACVLGALDHYCHLSTHDLVIICTLGVVLFVETSVFIICNSIEKVTNDIQNVGSTLEEINIEVQKRSGEQLKAFLDKNFG